MPTAAAAIEFKNAANRSIACCVGGQTVGHVQHQPAMGWRFWPTREGERRGYRPGVMYRPNPWHDSLPSGLSHSYRAQQDALAVTLTFDGAEGHATTLGEFITDNADGIEAGDVDAEAIHAALRDGGTYRGSGYTLAKAEG